jgi:hypothetical protein
MNWTYYAPSFTHTTVTQNATAVALGGNATAGNLSVIG